MLIEKHVRDRLHVDSNVNNFLFFRGFNSYEVLIIIINMYCRILTTLILIS